MKQDGEMASEKGGTDGLSPVKDLLNEETNELLKKQKKE